MNIPGEYYLTDVHEMGCGIKLNEDFTFEFFFSYGALDRHAYGTWKSDENNSIVLNTDYDNQVPFSIEHSEKRDFEGIKIGFPNYNKALLHETTIKVISNNAEEEQVVGAQDIFHFSSEQADAIIVTCLFYFDNPATLTPSHANHNYFELAANHGLPLVHFKNAIFLADETSLEGKLHIFDETKTFRFIK
jgi:hypothetical protein